MSHLKLSELVSKIRENRGETQREFGDYLETLISRRVSYGLIQTLENPNAKTIPSDDVLEAIAQINNMSMGELLMYLETY
jgi:transcriptional regulator with XRE-family HTH domain